MTFKNLTKKKAGPAFVAMGKPDAKYLNQVSLSGMICGSPRNTEATRTWGRVFLA